MIISQCYMNNNKIKILIADDEPLGRELLEAILFPEGYKLIFVVNGEEALNAAFKHNPDIILLDVMMPKMDGFEVCEKIRKNENIAHTPIFLITALDDRDSKRRGMDAGADDYISKPFDRNEILAKIKDSANLINSRNKKHRDTNIKINGTVSINNHLFEGFCDLHLSNNPKDKNILTYRSLPPTKSIHAFFHKKTETGTLYFMVSNSPKEGEAVLANLFLKELLLQSSDKNSDSPSIIVKNTLTEFDKTNKLATSILIILLDNKSEKLVASGINQTFYVSSISEKNNLPSNNPTFETLSVTANQEFEIMNPENVFLFSSGISEILSEENISSLLNMNFSSDKHINISEALKKFNKNRDIIIVNLRLALNI